MEEAGAALDRRVVQTLFDAWTDDIPEFSTRDSAADYLVRFLKRRSVTARIRLAGGTWECELSIRSGRVSSASAETRALAIARAVVHADVIPGRRRAIAQPNPPAKNRRVRTAIRDCAGCGIELKTARSSPSGVRYCNLCGWRQIRIDPQQRAS
ncbi:MAG: hypothetical protein LC796_12955 [Acidobacteria bacterium]|nr:hypothetical protein [Acidobacteriota bacterium]MCA1612047.1 hypothetical protein [Acidobacteriota bacterium]